MGMLDRLMGRKKGLSSVQSSGWTPLIHEPFTGAWQQNKELKREGVTSFYAVFACISKISQDLSKLPLLLKKKEGDIWVTTKDHKFNFLKRPNHFQTTQQFLEAWINSKHLRGNTYVLVQRDLYGRPEKYYVLNPDLVKPLVDDDGRVFYQLSSDKLSGLTDATVVVPASEIIHDRWNCFYHPLVGLPPIMACYMAVGAGMAIQNNSAAFFNNGGHPSGVLTAPGHIDKAKAEDMQQRWREKYSGNNAGNTAVLGDGLQYQAIGMSAIDAQLIEQLKLSGEIVCSAFKIHPFMIGMGTLPSGMKVSDLNELYYSGCMQTLIEAIENLFERHTDAERQGFTIEFDLKALIRMDSTAQMQNLKLGIDGAILCTNEARQELGLKPVEGGDSPMVQQQNYSLAALAKRDSKEDPFEKGTVYQLSAKEAKTEFAKLMGVNHES